MLDKILNFVEIVLVFSSVKKLLSLLDIAV